MVGRERESEVDRREGGGRGGGCDDKLDFSLVGREGESEVDSEGGGGGGLGETTYG